MNYEIKEGTKEEVVNLLNNATPDMTSFELIDLVSQRFSIEKRDMPKRYLVGIHLYWGMGDFTTYYGHGEDVNDAIIMSLVQYVNQNEFPSYKSTQYEEFIRVNKMR